MKNRSFAVNEAAPANNFERKVFCPRKVGRGKFPAYTHVNQRSETAENYEGSDFKTRVSEFVKLINRFPLIRLFRTRSSSCL